MNRFFNADILTPTEIIKGGELWEENGEITFISTVSPLIFLPWEREIDCKGNLLIPAFHNAHSHSAMTFLRSKGEGLPLQKWLNKAVFPNEAKLDTEAIYWFSRLAIAEYVRGGIASCMDMYFSLDGIASAIIESNFKGTLVAGVCDALFPLDNCENIISKEYEKYNNFSKNLKYYLGFHAPYSINKERLEILCNLSKEYKTPICTHINETKKEVEDSLKATNKTSIEYLDSLGVFENSGVVYHAIHMQDNEYNILRDKNVKVVGCPSSNMKLASGIADYVKLQKEKIILGLGTDGPASSNGLDMFKEMYLAIGLQKLKHDNAQAISCESVFNMATRGSAVCMGNNNTGCLEKGKRADIVLLDTHAENMLPNNDVLGDIIYSAGRENVLLTMVDGIILYENGKFNLGEDIDYIKGQVLKNINRIEKKIG